MSGAGSASEIDGLCPAVRQYGALGEYQPVRTIGSHELLGSPFGRAGICKANDREGRTLTGSHQANRRKNIADTSPLRRGAKFGLHMRTIGSHELLGSPFGRAVICKADGREGRTLTGSHQANRRKNIADTGSLRRGAKFASGKPEEEHS